MELLDLKEPKYEIIIHNYETDDVWIRDYGPIFLKHKSEGVFFRVIGFLMHGAESLICFKKTMRFLNG